MSPRNLLLLLLVGLCATQTVLGHREARGIKDFLRSAKSKLSKLVDKVEDAAGSAVDVVKKYAGKLDDIVLDAASAGLKKVSGLDVNLNALADLAKDNVKICANDNDVKTSAKAILKDLGSCVTNDMTSIKALKKDMEDMWAVAKNLPQTMAVVSQQCGQHVQLDTNVLEDPDEDDEELAAEAKDLVQAAEQRLTKRDADFLKRATDCMQTVFSLSKTDLNTIPGEMISAATNAYNILKTARGNIPSCVSGKLKANKDNIVNLGLKITSCVSGRIANSNDNSSDMAKLKAVDNLAKQLIALKDSKALDALNAVRNVVG